MLGARSFDHQFILAKPQFKDKYMKLAYELAYGKNGKELGLHPTQVGRIKDIILRYLIEGEQLFRKPK